MTLRYRLRTLLILLAILPPLLAAGWWGWREWRERKRREDELQALRAEMESIFTAFDGTGGGIREVPRNSPVGKLLKDLDSQAQNPPETPNRP